MNSSFMATMLWLTTIGLMAGGGYGVFKYFQDFQEVGKSLTDNQSIMAMKPKDIQDKESWLSFKKDSANAGGLGTGNIVRVMPGDPYTLPKPPVETKKDDTKKEEVKAPEYKSYEEVSELVLQEFDLNIAVRSIIPGSFGLAHAHFGYGPKPKSEQNNSLVKLRPGENLRETLMSLDSKVQAAAVAKYDMTLMEIHNTHVIISYAPADVATRLEEIKADERPADGRFTFQIDDENTAAKISDVVDKVKQVEKAEPGPGGKGRLGGTGRASGSTEIDPEIGKVRDGMTKVEVPQPEKRFAPEDMKSRKIDENTYFIGGEDQDEQTYNDAAKYVSEYIDPKTGEKSGLKVSDNMPENSALRRAGAEAGDLLKSINGVPLSSLGQARKYVNEQKKAGVTNFKVVFIRNGLEQTRTFQTAQKK